MKNKTLAIFGIGTYILSIVSSAENPPGNYTAPIWLILISGIAFLIFYIMATVRLRKEAKTLSIALPFSAIIHLILETNLVLSSPSYGSSIIILTNMVRAINFGALVFAIIKLFKIEDV